MHIYEGKLVQSYANKYEPDELHLKAIQTHLNWRTGSLSIFFVYVICIGEETNVKVKL